MKHVKSKYKKQKIFSKNYNLYASVAQSVEQGTENPCVGGSIPPRGTKFTLLV